MSDWQTAKLRELEEWRAMSGEEQDALIASGWHPAVNEPVTKLANPPITKQQAPRRRYVRGRGRTEVPVMQDNPNDLRVRVSYSTECPEWWRIQIRKRLGQQGLATREECKTWLREHGSSLDDDLWLEYEAWQEAAAEGIEAKP